MESYLHRALAHPLQAGLAGPGLLDDYDHIRPDSFLSVNNYDRGLGEDI